MLSSLLATAHLQSHGCTIVTGATVEAVNTFVRTLVLFLPPAERATCRLCTASTKATYIPDCRVHGLLDTAVRWGRER